MLCSVPVLSGIRSAFDTANRRPRCRGSIADSTPRAHGGRCGKSTSAPTLVRPTSTSKSRYFARLARPNRVIATSAPRDYRSFVQHAQDRQEAGDSDDLETLVDSQTADRDPAEERHVVLGRPVHRHEYSSVDSVRLTSYDRRAAIAGSFHEELAPAPLRHTGRSQIVLGLLPAVNSLEQASFQDLLACEASDWRWRYRHGIPS